MGKGDVRSSDVEDLGEGGDSDVALFGWVALFDEAAGACDAAEVHSNCALREFHTSGDSWHRPLGLVAEIPDTFIAFGEKQVGQNSCPHY